MTRYVAPWKMELHKKIGLFGLKDLSKLAPIGDIRYANGWYAPFGGSGWFNGLMERAVVDAAEKQGYRFTDEDRSFHRGCDTVYSCEEIGLTYHVDSSD